MALTSVNTVDFNVLFQALALPKPMSSAHIPVGYLYQAPLGTVAGLEKQVLRDWKVNGKRFFINGHSVHSLRDGEAFKTIKELSAFFEQQLLLNCQPNDRPALLALCFKELHQGGLMHLSGCMLARAKLVANTDFHPEFEYRINLFALNDGVGIQEINALNKVTVISSGETISLGADYDVTHYAKLTSNGPELLGQHFNLQDGIANKLFAYHRQKPNPAVLTQQQHLFTQINALLEHLEQAKKTLLLGDVLQAEPPFKPDNMAHSLIERHLYYRIQLQQLQSYLLGLEQALIDELVISQTFNQEPYFGHLNRINLSLAKLVAAVEKLSGKTKNYLEAKSVKNNNAKPSIAETTDQSDDEVESSTESEPEPEPKQNKTKQTLKDNTVQPFTRIKAKEKTSLASIMRSEELCVDAKITQGAVYLPSTSITDLAVTDKQGRSWLVLYIQRYLELLRLCENTDDDSFYQNHRTLGQLANIFPGQDFRNQDLKKAFVTAYHHQGLSPVSLVLQDGATKPLHKIKMIRRLLEMVFLAHDAVDKNGNGILDYIQDTFSALSGSESDLYEINLCEISGVIEKIASSSETQDLLNVGLAKVLNSNLKAKAKALLARCYLNAGADFKTRDKDGGTFLHLAVTVLSLEEIEACKAFKEQQETRLAMFAQQDNQGLSPMNYLLNAKTQQQLDKIRSLLIKGASVTATDNAGNSYLHLVCAQADPYFFNESHHQLFVADSSAAVNLKNQAGQTPLSVLLNSQHLSAQKAYWGLALIKAGADKTTTDRQGQSVYDYLVKIPAVEIERDYPPKGKFLDLAKRYRKFIKPSDDALTNARRLLSNYIRPFSEYGEFSCLSDSTLRFFTTHSRNPAHIKAVTEVLNCSEYYENVDALIKAVIKEIIPQPTKDSTTLDLKVDSSLYRRLDFLSMLYSQESIKDNIAHAKGIEQKGTGCGIM